MLCPKGPGPEEEPGPHIADIGVPYCKVELIKTSQQYIAPLTELDLSINDFYQENSSPYIESDNVFFIKELGIAMVAPLFEKRSNYIEYSLKPDDPRYITIHPGNPDGSGSLKESSAEINRRVFLPIPTIHQADQLKSGVDLKADFKEEREAWKNDKTYAGPKFIDKVTDKVTWVHQSSSSPNVEWALLQKQSQFTNQSFWIEVSKHKKVVMDADDLKLYGGSSSNAQTNNKNSRYHTYGGREVKGYFAIRVGWVHPPENRLEGADPTIRGYLYPTNIRGNYADVGPYDIVFPLDGTPFIWDHGADVNEDREGTGTEDIKSKVYDGKITSENSSEDWILKDSMKDFTVYVYFALGKMIIVSSFANAPWVFPGESKSFSTDTQEKYGNFFMPPGNICLLGRGFVHSFSFNPLEFNIYGSNGEKKEPTAKLMSRPVYERTDFPFPLGPGTGGYIDYKQWGLSGGEMRLPEDREASNFFVLPNGEIDNDIEGVAQTYSYGFDVVTDKPDHFATKSENQGGSTSMMIGVHGANPESMEESNKLSPVHTKMGPPIGGRPPSVEIRAFGWDAERSTQTPLNSIWNVKQIEIGLNCQKPSECPTVSVGEAPANTSERFASPIVWRVKAKHVVPAPEETTRVDVSGFVKEITYDTQGTDFAEVRQNYKVKFFIPKDYQFSDFVATGITDRQDLLDWLQRGVRDVEISLGWVNASRYDKALTSPPSVFNQSTSVSEKKADFPFSGHGVQVFRGMSVAGAMVNTFAEDTLTLECKDKLQILEDYPILNSPFYDGMSLQDAFPHICGLGGLPARMFAVESAFAHEEVLGVGYTFMEPAVKFDNGTTILEAIKNLSKRFWHVIRTKPDGTIVLTDLNRGSQDNRDQTSVGRHAMLECLRPTVEDFVFYVDGSETPDPFKRVYDSVTVNRDLLQTYSNIEILSIDRGVAPEPFTMVMDNTSWNIDAVEDPESADFLGYRKPMRITEPAFGSREKIWEQRKNLANHIYEPPLRVSFKCYGRPTLRPYDIIRIHFPGPSDHASWSIAVDKVDNIRSINFRVMSISGTLKVGAGMLYEMSVSAERI